MIVDRTEDEAAFKKRITDEWLERNKRLIDAAFDEGSLEQFATSNFLTGFWLGTILTFVICVLSPIVFWSVLTSLKMP